MFLLLHLLTRVTFKLYASYSFIVASYVMDLGLEVKAFREARYRCSFLECRVRVDLIGRDYELEISEILLMVDPVNGLSQCSIIAFMCTVTSRRVGCGCTVWTFTTLGECRLGLSLGLRPMKTHSSNQEIKSD